MKEVLQKPIRVFTPEHPPTILPPWTFAEDLGSILVPHPKLQSIYQVNLDTLDSERIPLPFRPEGLKYLNSVGFFSLDEEGNIWRIEASQVSGEWAKYIEAQSKKPIYRFSLKEINNHPTILMIGFDEHLYKHFLSVKTIDKNEEITKPIEVSDIMYSSPSDITIDHKNSLAYIPIHRGSGIEVRNINSSFDQIGFLDKSDSNIPFINPSQVKLNPATGDVWTNSYNCLVVWSLQDRSWSSPSQLKIVNSLGLVTDFDFSEDGKKIYAACFGEYNWQGEYIQGIRVIDSSTRAILPEETVFLEYKPSEIKVLNKKIYIKSSENETISMIQ